MYGVIGSLCCTPRTHSAVGHLYFKSEVAQSCPTLCDPMDCSLPRFSGGAGGKDISISFGEDATQPTAIRNCNILPLTWSCSIFTKYFLSIFPGGSDGKESACNMGDRDSFLESGRSPGEGNGNPLQYSCMDRGAW